MNIIKNENELIDLISKECSIIGIDGIDGVGKSTISKKISAKYGHAHLNLDKYLTEKKGEYFNYLNFEKLKNDLSKTKKVIIEGVVLQKVLQKIQIKPDYLIYMTDSGWLYDWSKELNGKYSGMKLNEVISDVENLTNRVSIATNTYSKQYKLHGLHLELYQYTYHYKPWKTADIIYEKP